jgi:DNA-binding PadR family transcriptional regulator
MMEELAHHGYRIGPGTLYPLLHGLEHSGLLKSVLKNVGGHAAGFIRSPLTARRL